MNTTQCITAMKIAPNKTEKGKQNREREREIKGITPGTNTQQNRIKRRKERSIFTPASCVFAAL